MDREYLHHIDSSPYVDEGFFNKAKQNFKNLLPSEEPYQTPLYSQLISYYDILINDIRHILSEFSEGPTSPAERLKKSNLTPEQETAVTSLVELYKLIVPSALPPGTHPKTRADFAKKAISPNISFAKSMQHLAKEAWLGRLKTRAGGDVGDIISKYSEEIRTAYFTFLANVAKLFPNQSTASVSQLFKNTVRNSKIINVLNNIETSIHITNNADNSSAQPPRLQSSPTGSTNNSTPTSTQSDQVKANDLATLIAVTLNIISQRVVDDENSAPYFAKPYYSDPSSEKIDYYLPASTEEPYPLKHGHEWNPPKPPSINSHDYAAAYAEYLKNLAAHRYEPVYSNGKITGYKYKMIEPEVGSVSVPTPPTGSGYPTSFTTPPITEALIGDETSNEEGDPELPPKEPLGQKTSDDSEDDSEDNSEDDLKDILDKEFLYAFASLHRKYHGKYTIEVTKTPVKVQMPSGTEQVIRVFWNWDEHLNTIIVKHRDIDNQSSWTDSELLKFFDDEVNPQSPYYKSNFNIPHFLEEINPNARALYFKADPSLIEQVDNALRVFKPSVYAVIRRKGPMEFKAHKSLRFYIPPEFRGQVKGNANYGSVKLLRGSFEKKARNDIIKFSELKDVYFKSTPSGANKIKAALDNADYWEAYENIKNEFFKPLTPEEEAAAIAAASSEVSPEPEPATEPPTTTSTPTSVPTPTLAGWKGIKNAADASLALKVLKFPFKDINIALQRAVDTIGTDKTTQEYIKTALKYLSPPTATTPKPEPAITQPEQNIDPVQAPSPEPINNVPSDAQTGSPIQSKENEVLTFFNNKLKSLGIEELDNIKQLVRLNSLKGNYNASITKRAQVEDNEDILKLKLVGGPSEAQKDIWIKLVSKAKNIPNSKTSPDLTTEGLINPYQLFNFI